MKSKLFIYILLGLCIFLVACKTNNSPTSLSVDTENSPLISATQSGDTTTIKQLLEQGADVNKGIDGNKTALMFAISNNNMDAVSLLLEYGANVNAISDNELTPLIIASIKGHSDIASVLLQNGAKPELRGVDSLTPLHHAVLHEHHTTILTLLEYGADINVRSEGGFTSLILASEKGLTNTVRLLLDKGANIDAQTIHGITAVITGVVHNRKEVVALLIQRGANLELMGIAYKNDTIKGTALILAIVKNKITLANLLLDGGASVLTRASTGASVLMAAVPLNNTKLLQSIIDKGADVNYMPPSKKYDYTALMYAVTAKKIESARLLLENGARLDIARHNGDTAMSLAHKVKQAEMINLLKKYQ